MSDEPLLRVFAKGGVLSPADLLATMDASEAAGNAFVLFSSRQDILFPAAGDGRSRAEGILRDSGLEFIRVTRSRLHEPFQPRNIVSSYVAVNVVETTWWLQEAVYQSALAQFDQQPRLSVHLVDPVQSLVPLFGGHLHFVASRREQYWHVYVRAQERSQRIVRWHGLVHGDDLAGVTRVLESRHVESPETPLPRLLDDLSPDVWVDDPQSTSEARLPSPSAPYYEGLEPMLHNQHWLGLYWRNNRFDLPFMRAACRLCQETAVGKISLTPWKSFIVKGIRATDRIRWEKLLGGYGINLRHSSLELNWHIPVLDAEALELKNELVRVLTMEDISTHGLTFTVKSEQAAPLFTSIVIESEAPRPGRSPTYAIRHARDFDPNTCEYVVFATGVARAALPDRMIELSKRYSGQLGVGEPAEQRATHADGTGADDAASHRCLDCHTVYDPAYGDPLAAVPAGVSFSSLPDDYRCPTCAAGVTHFAPVSIA